MRTLLSFFAVVLLIPATSAAQEAADPINDPCLRQIISSDQAAATTCRKALVDAERKGKYSRIHLIALRNWAGVEWNSGKQADGEKILLEILKRAESSFGPSDSLVADIANVLGALYTSLPDRWNDAQQLLSRALELRLRNEGPGSIKSAVTEFQLGRLSILVKDLDKGIAYLQSAREKTEHVPPEDWRYGRFHQFALEFLGFAYAMQGKLDAAEPLLKEALQIKTKFFSQDKDHIKRNRELLANVQRARSESPTASNSNVGPGDLRIGMTWDQARNTKFLASAEFLWDPVPSERTPVRRSLKDLESGFICLTLHPYTKKFHRYNYCNPPPDNDPTFRPISVPYSELLQRNFTFTVASTFFGAQRKVWIKVENQRISNVTIEFGDYYETLSDQVLKALRERYGKLIGPDISELAAFSEGRTKCYSHTTPQKNVTFFVYGGNQNPVTQLVYGPTDSKCLPKAILEPGEKL